MDEIEIRQQALLAAKEMQFWSTNELLNNAQEIEHYLWHGSTKPIKTVPTKFTDTLKINNPNHGYMDLAFYSHQKTTWSAIEKCNTLIINAARQMGLSTLFGAYAYEYAIKSPSKVVRVVSHKFETAKHIGHLFKSQSNEIDKVTSDQIVFKNNSIILLHGPKDIATDIETDALIIDCAAFIPFKHDEDLLKLTNSVKHKCIISSTPSVNAGFFYNVWNSNSPYRAKLLLPWYMHDERSDDWGDRRMAEMGHSPTASHTFLSEYCCQFIQKY